MNLLNKIHSFFIKPQYHYGQLIRPNHHPMAARDGEHRLNKLTGDVEFLLWKAGEQGHKFRCWHRMGDGWINWFVPFSRGVEK